MKYIAEELKDEWNHFLEILNKKSGSNKKIPTEGESGRENINKFFESKAFQVKWGDLKETLYAMEKDDGVKYIEKNFLFTQGKLVCL